MVIGTGAGLNAKYLLVLHLGQSLVATVLLANTPQVILSCICILYNHCLTTMASTLEYCRFASIREPLRVSRPQGQQRSTHWRNVPWWYGRPLIISMTILHWLVSRSIFLVQVRVLKNSRQ
jgi:hypothetical protein